MFEIFPLFEFFWDGAAKLWDLNPIQSLVTMHRLSSRLRAGLQGDTETRPPPRAAPRGAEGRGCVTQSRETMTGLRRHPCPGGARQGFPGLDCIFIVSGISAAPVLPGYER